LEHGTEGKPGDFLLCYATRVSRWVGLLEVVSEPFRDSSPIWKDEAFPVRLRVKPIISLELENGIPVYSMKDQLSMFQPNGDKPPGMSWTGHFRGSPAKWKSEDALAVIAALHDAQRNPVDRPIDANLLKKTAQAVATSIGLVTVPEPDSADENEKEQEPSEGSLHTEIQSLLLRLGSEMGFDVWVASNDRGRAFNGQRLGEMPRTISRLPLQFDPATLKTVALIDVLWLKGNAIVAAFEIEITTSIYSGLLRMADLIAMQPNINVPLFLVAPSNRRNKVFAEVNRPTFSRLSPKLAEVCRYISFCNLKQRVMELSSVLRYLKPDFLEDLSEPCEIDDAG
jgi:hypothetical protein